MDTMGTTMLRKNKEIIIFENNYEFTYKRLKYNRIGLYSFFRCNDYKEKYEILFHEKKINKYLKYGSLLGENDYYELIEQLKDDNFLKYFFRIIKHMKKDNEIEYKFFCSIKEWKQVKKYLFYYE